MAIPARVGKYRTYSGGGCDRQVVFPILLQAKKRESIRARARLIRLAEATFGPRDPRIKEFRPATEGKVRTTRGPEAVRKSHHSRMRSGERQGAITSPMPPAASSGEVSGSPEMAPPKTRTPAGPVMLASNGSGAASDQGAEGRYRSARFLAYRRYGLSGRQGDRSASLPFPSKGPEGPEEPVWPGWQKGSPVPHTRA